MSQDTINTYIQAIQPHKGYRERLRQYHKAKNDLLDYCPVGQHSTVIRALCKHLGI